VLQIDSHMRFVSGWDEILIQQLGACGQDKAVLSTYPPGYALPDNVGGVLCKRNFASSECMVLGVFGHVATGATFERNARARDVFHKVWGGRFTAIHW
jgi:hypothetical protein